MIRIRTILARRCTRYSMSGGMEVAMTVRNAVRQPRRQGRIFRLPAPCHFLCVRRSAMTSSGERFQMHQGRSREEQGSKADDTADADLDELLKDALSDFGRPSPRQESQERAIASTSSSAQPPKFDPLGSAPRKAQKAKKFDPLAKSKSRKPNAARTDHSREGDFGSVPPDISDLDEELTKGLQRLMQELAEVDQQGGAPVAGVAPPASQFSDTTRALSDTQAVLREQSGIPAEEQFSSNLLAGLGQQATRGGEGGQDALGGFADGIMRQLLSKEVLHQPMKDIGARYPAWLDAHRDSLPPEELAKYEEQYRHIQAILHIYEDHPDDYADLFSALQQMQACGQPPQDIVNDLAPGMAFDEDGLPKLPQTTEGPPGCALQ